MAAAHHSAPRPSFTPPTPVVSAAQLSFNKNNSRPIEQFPPTSTTRLPFSPMLFYFHPNLPSLSCRAEIMTNCCCTVLYCTIYTLKELSPAMRHSTPVTHRFHLELHSSLVAAIAAGPLPHSILLPTFQGHLGCMISTGVLQYGIRQRRIKLIKFPLCALAYMYSGCLLRDMTRFSKPLSTQRP